MLFRSEKSYLEGGFQPQFVEEFLKDIKNHKEYRQVLQLMTESAILVKINEDFLLHHRYYNTALNLLRDYIVQNKEMTLSQFRDLLDTSRKYALPLLEFFDQNKITKRIGEKRVLF